MRQIELVFTPASHSTVPFARSVGRFSRDAARIVRSQIAFLQAFWAYSYSHMVYLDGYSYIGLYPESPYII